MTVLLSPTAESPKRAVISPIATLSPETIPLSEPTELKVTLSVPSKTLSAALSSERVRTFLIMVPVTL